MAGRSDIEAGKAHILLYVKNSALVKGLNAAKKQLQGLGTSILKIGGFLTGLGAGLVTPLVAAVATFASMGSELADLSARTGESVGSLAELKFAAEQTGASLADIEIAIRNQQKSGVKGTFDQIAAKIAAIEDPAKRTKKAMEVWGKAGTKLLPMVENLQALRKEARDLGLVPTEQAVKMADDVGDAVDKIKSVLAATVFEVGAALAPMLLPALETVKKIAGAFNNWAKQNGAIIRTVAMIAAGVLAAGVAVTVIGALVFGLGTAFGLVASGITALAGAVGFLLSPTTLVVAAIVAGVAAWARFTKSGQAAVKAIVDFFLPMIDTIRTAIGGIGDALMAGDLTLAGQIAVKALQVVFAQGLAQIAALMGGVFGDLFGTIASQLVSGDFAGAWETVSKQIAAVWDQLMAGMLAAFKSLADGILSIWNGVTKILDKSISGISRFLRERGGAAGAAAATALGAVQLGGRIAGAPIGAGLNVVSAAAGIGSQAQNQKAAKSAAEFAAAIAGGGDKAGAMAEKLAAELDELRKQAAQAREAAATTTPAAAVPALTDELKAAASGTFSAAGAVALGFGGGGPTVRIAKAAEKTVEKLDVLHKDFVSLRDKLVPAVAAP